MTDYGYDREAALAHLRANLTRYTEEDYSLGDIGDDIQHHLVLPVPTFSEDNQGVLQRVG